MEKAGGVRGGVKQQRDAGISPPWPVPDGGFSRFLLSQFLLSASPSALLNFEIIRVVSSYFELFRGPGLTLAAECGIIPP
jgi:hypothetical protein